MSYRTRLQNMHGGESVGCRVQCDNALVKTHVVGWLPTGDRIGLGDSLVERLGGSTVVGDGICLILEGDVPDCCLSPSRDVAGVINGAGEFAS